MIRNSYLKRLLLKNNNLKKASDHISVLSDQNGDLAGHMSFQERKIICSPEIWTLLQLDYFKIAPVKQITYVGFRKLAYSSCFS